MVALEFWRDFALRLSGNQTGSRWAKHSEERFKLNNMEVFGGFPWSIGAHNSLPITNIICIKGSHFQAALLTLARNRRSWPPEVFCTASALQYPFLCYKAGYVIILGYIL